MSKFQRLKEDFPREDQLAYPAPISTTVRTHSILQNVAPLPNRATAIESDGSGSRRRIVASPIDNVLERGRLLAAAQLSEFSGGVSFQFRSSDLSGPIKNRGANRWSGQQGVYPVFHGSLCGEGVS
jgi:hypothetical protein